jgi:hypothetical protein
MTQCTSDIMYAHVNSRGRKEYILISNYVELHIILNR